MGANTSHLVELGTILSTVIALLAFIIMDILNRLRNLFDQKENELNELRNKVGETENLKNRVAELEAIIANSAVVQSELEQVSTFLTERGS